MDELRAARIQDERWVRHVVVFGLVVLVVAASVVFVLFKTAAAGSANVSTSRSDRAPAANVEPPSSAADDASVEQTLQQVTGLAARLLSRTEDTEVARSALVAAQDVTGCAPKEGGPALVHIGNAAEKAAERASRADFYATAQDNGRDYATLAHAQEDRRTIVYVAVAWECSSGP